MTASAPSSPDTLLAASTLIYMDHDPHCDLLYELRDVPVGIGQMSGSHFTTLKTLSEVLPKEHINTVHTGGPGQRLGALQEEEVQATNLLDPDIPIAEARGLRKLVQGEFLITIWVSPTISKRRLVGSSER